MKLATGLGMPAVFILAIVWVAYVTVAEGALDVGSPMRQFPLTEIDLWIVRFTSLISNPFTWLLMHATEGVGQRVSMLAYQFSVAAIFVGLAIVSGASRHEWRSKKPSEAVPSRFPKLLRKDISAAFRLFDTMFACLVVLLFLAYVVYEPHPDLQALWICPVIVTMANTTHALNLFGSDGGQGLERYILLPLTGMRILRIKVFSTAVILAVQLAPIVVVSFWFIGVSPALATFAECLSLGLILLSWGVLVTIRHSYVLKPYRMAEGGSLFATLFALMLCLIPGLTAHHNVWFAFTLPPVAALGLFYALKWAGRRLEANPEKVRARLA
jgi:hypothetical protein